MEAGDLADLQAKAAFFEQLAKGHYVDDEWDPLEAQDRQRRRLFFKPRPKLSKDADRLSGANVETPRDSHHSDSREPGTPASTQPGVVKNTPLGTLQARRNGRVAFLLNSDAFDDTVIPDSTKPMNKLLQRSNSTPLPRLKRTGSNPHEDSPSAGMAAKKKLKTVHSDPKLRSGAKLILKGLAFFYVPNNDIAPVRKLRINKAREHGAEWTRNIATASHVVVDRALDYKSVESFLLRQRSSQKPVIVNEDYPIDCIQFGSVLDPRQAKYRVTGQPSAHELDSDPIEIASSFESVRSLKIKAGPKNPRSWDYVPPPGTPARSGESSSSNPQDSIAKSRNPPQGDKAVSQGEGSPTQPRTDSNAGSPEGSLVAPDVAAGKKEDNRPPDELTSLISLVNEYKDLPVDEDDDVASTDTCDAEDISSAGSEEEQPRTKRTKRNGSQRGKKPTFEQRFACGQASAKDANSENPNVRTIDILQKMATYYDRVNDHWRTTAYRKAISTLKRQNCKITTQQEAQKLPGVGASLAQKIEEIVTTDKLQRLEYAQQDTTGEALQLFMGIYGVGNRQAQQWIAQGLRTLDDVREKARLTTNQKLGVEYYDDLNTRIPRREMEELGSIVTATAEELDPEVEVIIGGSYRRGAETSGDIDFIVTKRGTTTTADLAPFLQRLVRKLKSSGFLVARLASSRSDEDGSKWHGCCVLPAGSGTAQDDGAEPRRSIWRRIDFLVVPETERGAALIYFTGNDIFNRSMRLLASTKGFRLNQRGLHRDVLRGPQRKKLSEGELVEGADEKKIFEILGVRWREPHERWC